MIDHASGSTVSVLKRRKFYFYNTFSNLTFELSSYQKSSFNGTAHQKLNTKIKIKNQKSMQNIYQTSKLKWKNKSQFKK